MPKFNIRVSDEITYERIWDVEVEAKDLEEAKLTAMAKVSSGQCDHLLEEEQIDSTPYAADEIEDE